MSIAAVIFAGNINPKPVGGRGSLPTTSASVTRAVGDTRNRDEVHTMSKSVVSRTFSFRFIVLLSMSRFDAAMDGASTDGGGVIPIDLFPVGFSVTQSAEQCLQRFCDASAAISHLAATQRQRFVDSVVYHADNVSDHSKAGSHLSRNEKITVAWFTSDVRSLGGRLEGNWWFVVNGLLRRRDLDPLRDHHDALWYLQSAFDKISATATPQTVWRGLRDVRLTQISHHYRQGCKICWPAFSSTSKDRTVMSSFGAGGAASAAAGSTLLKLTVNHYAELEALSMLPSEAECLLGINTVIEVQHAVPTELLDGFPGLEGLAPNVDLVVCKQVPTPAFGAVSTRLRAAESAVIAGSSRPDDGGGMEEMPTSHDSQAVHAGGGALHVEGLATTELTGLQVLLGGRYHEHFVTHIGLRSQATMDDLYVDVRVVQASINPSQATPTTTTLGGGGMATIGTTTAEEAMTAATAPPCCDVGLRCTAETIGYHVTPGAVVLVDGPAGVGKTSFAKRICRLQAVPGFLAVFVTLRDLVGVHDLHSVRSLLMHSFQQLLSDNHAMIIEREKIPVVWLLDGFDEVQQTKDEPLREFLRHFVDPRRRRQHLADGDRCSLIRSCDAVVVTSREDRVPNDDCDLNLKPQLGGAARWVIELWDEPKVRLYCTQFFSVVDSDPATAATAASDRESRAPLLERVTNILCDSMPGFAGLALVARMTCELCAVDPTLALRVTPAGLFELTVMDFWNRSKARLSTVFASNPELLQGPNGETLSVDDRRVFARAIDVISSRAIESLLRTGGGAVQFYASSPIDVTICEAIVETGLLRRGLGPGQYCFAHRMYLEYFGARGFATANPRSKALHRLPLHKGLRTTWMLLADLVVVAAATSERRTAASATTLLSTTPLPPPVSGTDVFPGTMAFDAHHGSHHASLLPNVVVSIKSDDFCETVVQKLVGDFDRLPNLVRQRLSDLTASDRGCDLAEEHLPLRLLAELSAIVPPVDLLGRLRKARALWFLRGVPPFVLWVAELCAELEAVEGLSYLLGALGDSVPRDVLNSAMARISQRSTTTRRARRVIQLLEARGVTLSLRVAASIGAARAVAVALRNSNSSDATSVGVLFQLVDDALDKGHTDVATTIMQLALSPRVTPGDERAHFTMCTFRLPERINVWVGDSFLAANANDRFPERSQLATAVFQLVYNSNGPTDFLQNGGVYRFQSSKMSELAHHFQRFPTSELIIFTTIPVARTLWTSLLVVRVAVCANCRSSTAARERNHPLPRSFTPRRRFLAALIGLTCRSLVV